MADLSDVEDGVVGAVLESLYPNGSGQPSSIGCPVRVYRGWPLVASLATDLAAGVANVSVFPVSGSTRSTTRWMTAQAVQPGNPTLCIEVSEQSVTFGGSGGAGQLVGVLIDNVPFVYRSNMGDSPQLIAAIIWEMIHAVRPCWLSGETLTVQGATRIIVRVVADATMSQEWCRQSQGVRISAWCPDPATRDRVCSDLGSSLSAQSFLLLPNGEAARISYRSTASIDDHQAARQYRRDLIYDVEYGTSAAGVSPVMLFGDLELTGRSIYN